MSNTTIIVDEGSRRSDDGQVQKHAHDKRVAQLFPLHAPLAPTLYPCRFSSSAATAESTPPEIPTTTWLPCLGMWLVLFGALKVLNVSG